MALNLHSHVIKPLNQCYNELYCISNLLKRSEKSKGIAKLME
jgi:hypothetical protein